MLDRSPRIVELTVPRGRSPRCPDGVRVRRRDLAAIDIVGNRDLWLTAAPLTALETAVALADGSGFLDRALQRHVRFPTVYRAYCRNLGRHGSSAAGRLLVAAADRADSAAERLLVRLLRDAGIGGWVTGPPVRAAGGSTWRSRSRRSRSRWTGGRWHVDAERFRCGPPQAERSAAAQAGIR